MTKYVCSVCGYVYDPEVGDRTAELLPEPASKICPRIGYARYAA